MQEKRISRGIRLGKLAIGGGAPVMVQSMTNTDTRDVEATLAQIDRLVRRGCEAVRVAVPDMTAAKALRALRDGSPVPLIADIHFDYRLALAALEAGLEGLRINPGNIGPREHVDRVVDAAKANGAVIRVGVNSGSVEKHLLQKYGGPCVEAMVESALSHVRMLEDRGFYDTKISLKSSCWPNPATIRCTSASPRRAGSCAARSSPLWAWVFCCTRASATPCASRSRPIPPRK